MDWQQYMPSEVLNSSVKHKCDNAGEDHRTVAYIGEDDGTAGIFNAAPALSRGSLDAIATLAPIAPGRSLEVNGREAPLIHASSLGGGEWSDVSVHCLSDAGASISLLLSQGISPERIHLSKEGQEDSDARTIAADICSKRLDWGSLRNTHRGSRAFILGNGPSLRISDLDRLNGEITFASNKIYLAFGQTDWRPTYYTVCDQLVAKYNAVQINQMESTALMPSTLEELNCSFRKGMWYDERFENKFISATEESERKSARLFFSRDIRFGVHGGYTVIYHQIQLAYHMGIREIFLIGVDFHFILSDKTTEDKSFASPVYRKALVSQGEVNHFHKEYRKPGEKWSMPRLDLQEHAFRTARLVIEDEGGCLVNASRRTALTGLPRGDFDNILPP